MALLGSRHKADKPKPEGDGGRSQGGIDRAAAADNMRSDRRHARKALKAAKTAEAARRGREHKASPGRKAAQDALGWERLFESGLILVEDGTWSRVVEFDDVNLQTADDDTQRTILERWRSMLNQLDPSIKVQVKVVCHLVEPDRYLAEATMHDVPGDDLGNTLRHQENAIMASQVAAAGAGAERRRLLVLTTLSESPRDAEATLSSAIQNVSRALLGLGATVAEALDGDALLGLVDSVTNPKDERGQACFDCLREPDAKGRTRAVLGWTTRDLVCPPDVRHGQTDVGWGDCWGRALYISSWGKSVRTSMLSALVELPVNQVLTLDIRPWDSANAIEVVESAYTDLKAQRTEYVLDHSQDMVVTDEMLPSTLQDALASVGGTRDDLVNGDELLFTVSLSTLVWAGSEDERDRAVESIQGVARRFGCRLDPMRRLQMRGFAAAMPTGRYDIPFSRTMSSSPLAALMPFTSSEIYEPGGIYLGQNVVSKSLVIYDRAGATAPNGFILGQLGRGKSVAAKQMIIQTRLVRPDDDVVIIDPEAEYKPVVDALGGRTVKVGAGSEAHFNPFELALEEGADGQAQLELKTDMIISAVIMMAKTVTEMQKSLVDRCVRQVYERYLDTRDPADQPVLSDLYDALNAQPEPEAHVLATTIERYVRGQASIFNHPSNVDVGPSERLVCFDIRDNGENMMPMVELFVLDWCWQRVVRNRALGRRTWIFVDEIHLLLDSEYSVRYFDSLWSRSRKYGAIPTGITQNAERLLENDRTRKMLSNSDFLILLGQSSTDASTIGNERGLSTEQVSFLERAMPGQGIVIAGRRVVEFENRIPENSPILALINTRPGRPTDGRP